MLNERRNAHSHLHVSKVGDSPVTEEQEQLDE